MKNTGTCLHYIQLMISTCVAIKNIKRKALTWGDGLCARMKTSLHTTPLF
jgi:hypothetical protein